MENITIENLYDLTETIAAELFTEAEYPWEVLPRIHDFILELGKRLPEEIYEKRGEDIWVRHSIRKFMRNVEKISGWQRVQLLHLLHA